MPRPDPTSLEQSDRRKWPTVDKAHVAVCRRVDQRYIARHDVGGELASRRPNAESMTAEAGRKIEAGQRIDGRNHWNGVGRGIDCASPGLRDFDALQLGI